RDLVEFLGRDPGKIHVLGVLGVDGPFAYEHVENDVIDILHPARFSPNKAQDLSMKAVKILARRYENIRLWLVGGRGVTRADQEYLERIYRDAEEINRELGREVIRVVVDARDIGEFYRLADICLIPSTWSEGYGLTVIECMAYGKPVIASDLFRETGAADDERAYIVRRGDLEALTQALEHVINNRSEALEKALKALDFVRRNCSWDEVARRIEIILSDMIERRTE
ncbi:MAG: glycosyltransferase family 4 protein, partial [Sulfolobales archaeon]